MQKTWHIRKIKLKVDNSVNKCVNAVLAEAYHYWCGIDAHL